MEKGHYMHNLVSVLQFIKFYLIFLDAANWQQETSQGDKLLLFFHETDKKHKVINAI